MKLDRNINQSGKGKYALVRLRGIEAGSEAHKLLWQLYDLGVLDWGMVGDPDEFFVMKLKDKFSYRGLLGYMKGIELEETPEFEFAQAILDMAKRAGPNSPYCKIPD